MPFVRRLLALSVLSFALGACASSPEAARIRGAGFGSGADQDNVSRSQGVELHQKQDPGYHVPNRTDPRFTEAGASADDAGGTGD